MSKKFLYGDEFILTSRNSSGTIVLKSGANEKLEIQNLVTKSTGGFFQTNSSESLTLALASFTDVNISTTPSTNFFNFTHNNAGRLTYTGTQSGLFLVSYNVSFNGTLNDEILFGVTASGATPNGSSQTLRKIESTLTVHNLTNTSVVSLPVGGYFMLRCANMTGVRPINIIRLNITVVSLF